MQVSQLLASRNFQRHSGPVLESLSLQPDNGTCFNFDASPEAYPVRPSSCLHSMTDDYQYWSSSCQNPVCTGL